MSTSPGFTLKSGLLFHSIICLIVTLYLREMLYIDSLASTVCRTTLLAGDTGLGVAVTGVGAGRGAGVEAGAAVFAIVFGVGVAAAGFGVGAAVGEGVGVVLVELGAGAVAGVAGTGETKPAGGVRRSVCPRRKEALGGSSFQAITSAGRRP